MFDVVCLFDDSRTARELTLRRAHAGDLTFNPEKDTLVGADGQEVKLEIPFGDELPERGFDPGEDTFQAPPSDGSGVSVRRAVDS